MLKWLAKYKISNALNQGERLAPFWRKRMAHDPALEEFQQAATALDQRLQSCRNPAGTSLPPDLHAAIMTAVKKEGALKRAEYARLPRREWSVVVRWGMAPASLLLLAGGFCWLTQRQSPVIPPPPPGQVASAPATVPVDPWTLARQAATDAPTLLTAPLAQESENILKDFHATTQFLLASLP